MLPFIGLIVSLTLWGTFLPVPFTDVNPNESFVGRLGGAIKTAYLATGAYELAQTVPITAPGYGHGVVGGFPVINDAGSVFVPTPTWAGTQFVYVLGPVESMEPTRTTPGGEGSDSSDSSGASARGIAGCLVGVLVLALFQRVGLVSYSAHTLNELAEELGGKLFGPAKVDYYLEADDPIEVSLDSIVAMVDQSRAPVEGGIASSYLSYDASMFTLFLAYRHCPQPCHGLDLVLFQRPVVRPVARKDVMTFHHVADEALSNLVRLRGDEEAKDLGLCTTAGPDTYPDVAFLSLADLAPASADVSGFDYARLRRRKALVPFRMENISRFVVLWVVCFLLANRERFATAVKVKTPVDKPLDKQVAKASEVDSKTEERSKDRRAQRPSQKQRRRRARNKKKGEQAVLVANLEAESCSGPSPPSPPPTPAPAPATSTPSPKPALDPVAEAVPEDSESGEGRLSRPPDLPPPPKCRKSLSSSAEPATGSGAPVQPPPQGCNSKPKNKKPKQGPKPKPKADVRAPPASQAQG